MEKRPDSLFQVLVDAKLEPVRERAKSGDADAMIELACHVKDGRHTRSNSKLALQIVDVALANREKFRCPESLWYGLICKTELVEEEAAEPIFVELIRHMTSSPSEKWDFFYLAHAVQWLESNRLDREAGN